VRSEAVSKQYGAGHQSEQPKDRFDELALAGKGSLEVVHDGMHSKLVVTRPLLAKKDFAAPTAPAATWCRRIPCWVRCALTTPRHPVYPGRAEHPHPALSLTVIFGLGLLLTLCHSHLDRPPPQPADRLHGGGHRPARLRPPAGRG
jgi:hypothetical protein